MITGGGACSTVVPVPLHIPTGRSWELDNLYVSNASVFSSASGVNPMVTNMAISDWISRGIAKDLRLEGRKEEEQGESWHGLLQASSSLMG